jgi:hypothetical protein
MKGRRPRITLITRIDTELFVISFARSCNSRPLFETAASHCSGAFDRHCLRFNHNVFQRAFAATEAVGRKSVPDPPTQPD